MPGVALYRQSTQTPNKGPPTSGGPGCLTESFSSMRLSSTRESLPILHVVPLRFCAERQLTVYAWEPRLSLCSSISIVDLSRRSPVDFFGPEPFVCGWQPKRSSEPCRSQMYQKL